MSPNNALHSDGPHNLLVAAGVNVWFSEKDLGLGVPMMRAIDTGLANLRIGLSFNANWRVVTPK